MAVELSERGKILELRTTGKLTHEDYQAFVPTAERLIAAHGKIRLLMVLHDFHGWELAALWDDVKFDVKHLRDIERLAIVGESKWEKGMALFCKPFTSAEVRYFDHADVAAAKSWIDSA